MNCEKCGNPIHSGTAFCEHCGQPVPEQPMPTAEQSQAAPEVPARKPENLATGIVGALIGAALGGGSIILLSQLGYVASLSGFILAICTLKGYELLGGRLSKKGIFIAVALMLVTPYIADRIDWAIVLMNSYTGITLGQAFSVIPTLIEEGAIEQSDYLSNLGMIYLFAALGAASTLGGLFKKKK